MKAAVARCIAAAAVALAMWTGAEFLAIVFACDGASAWSRRQQDPAAVVLERGEQIARPGDALYLCVVPHAFATVVWHTDLRCTCAPRSMALGEVGAAVGGTCVVDHATPSLDDRAGACRFSRCSVQIDVP